MKERHSIGAGEFKSHCLKLIDEVHDTKEPLVITKHGKPLVKLVPIEVESYTLFGHLKGSVVINDDIIKSTGEKWEAGD